VDFRQLVDGAFRTEYVWLWMLSPSVISTLSRQRRHTTRRLNCLSY
jgi:hypothetical protein